MMNTEGGQSASDTHEPRPSIWDDPDLPAGNAPPLPGWPLWVSAAAFGMCVLFLAITAATG